VSACMLCGERWVTDYATHEKSLIHRVAGWRVMCNLDAEGLCGICGRVTANSAGKRAYRRLERTRGVCLDTDHQAAVREAYAALAAQGAKAAKTRGP
jgi:hypothetical protein